MSSGAWLYLFSSNVRLWDMKDLDSRLTAIGILISVIGAIVIMAGLILGFSPLGNVGSTSFGGVIVIGPIPIVFGTDRVTVLIAVIGAVILMVAAFALVLVNSRKARHAVGETSI
jgi:uncharacterized membrane protein